MYMCMCVVYDAVSRSNAYLQWVMTTLPPKCMCMTVSSELARGGSYNFIAYNPVVKGKREDL
jgi:hypothetical protein